MLEGSVVMKAVILKRTCEANELVTSEINIPKIKEGYVLVKINAFGINRSEIILRQYEADEDHITLPIVPGIECVGTIIESLSDDFKKGDRIVSLMGGMGRSFNGSYEEYALLPTKNVFKIKGKLWNSLSTEEIAAIPETYFTAFGSLFECLMLNSDDVLLIRGGSSATGLTALALAKVIGCKIITTSRKKERVSKLLSLGADYVLIDDDNLSDKVHEIYPGGVSKILELIGPKTMSDSFKCLEKQGICCVTGVLGNQEFIKEFDPIKYLPNGKYLTSFFSNHPTQEIIDDIFEFVIENNVQTSIASVFYSLDDICKAHELMESNNAQGKIIIKLEDFE